MEKTTHTAKPRSANHLAFDVSRVVSASHLPVFNQL